MTSKYKAYLMVMEARQPLCFDRHERWAIIQDVEEGLE
jgi:hypothetical protein